MRMFIPELGTVITLAEDWTFAVINEGRNRSLAALILPEKTNGIDYYFTFGTQENPIEMGRSHYKQRIPIDPGTYTIKAGTSLEVDRIYIRKGNEDFSSVSFKMRLNGKAKQYRFFARLNDVNNIVF